MPFGFTIIFMRLYPVLCILIAVGSACSSAAQRQAGNMPAVPTFIETAAVHSVMVFDGSRYGGTARMLAPGRYALRSAAEFNECISSLKIPAGIGVLLYEHAGVAGGYGRYTDLLEDCPDLSVYGMEDVVSYLVIFILDRPGYEYVRGRVRNGVFIPGHWDPILREGKGPDNRPPATVSFLGEDAGRGDQCRIFYRLLGASEGHLFPRTRVRGPGPVIL